MNILITLYWKYFKFIIPLWFSCFYLNYSTTHSDFSSAKYLCHLQNQQRQWRSLSPIEFLTDLKFVTANVNTFFEDHEVISRIFNAKKILDKLSSNEWRLSIEEAKYLDVLLNSSIFAKPTLQKNLNHCRSLLNKWFADSSSKTARYFYHAFHLLLNPSTYVAHKNLLFSNNPPNSGNLASSFLCFIKQMYFTPEKELRIFFYQMNQPQIIEAIENLAYWIGPQRIKIILEEDYLLKDKLREDPSDHLTALKRLLKCGISVRTDKSIHSKGNGESHHKFSVIGEDHVFTGSWNPTLSGTNRNFNHAFWLNSTQLAKLYKLEFEQIWSGKSQSRKDSQWDYRWIKIDGGQARVFFAPQDPLKDVIISMLQRAKKKILIGLFFFTDPDILDLLRIKKASGVKVNIVMDNLGIGSRVAQKNKSLAQILKKFNLEHWSDDSAGHWHHKAAVIDGKRIISGSANWSKSAFTKNDENLLQIDHPELAKQLESILGAKQSFKHWIPRVSDITKEWLIPNYWRIIREGSLLKVQLPPDFHDWQIRLNGTPVKTKISTSNSLIFSVPKFFESKKDELIDLFHPNLKRLHSIFFSNHDGVLDKKSLSLLKSQLVVGDTSKCHPGKPDDDFCFKSKLNFKGCIQAKINDWQAEPWENCY